MCGNTGYLHSSAGRAGVAAKILFRSCRHVNGFITLYLLQDLHRSYLEYTAWLAAGVLGQIITVPMWGHMSDRYGNKVLISLCGLFVPVLPILYLFSTAVPYLVMVNFFGGVLWAGLALGLQNFVFQAVPREERALGVAVWNAANAVGWLVGAMGDRAPFDRMLVCQAREHESMLLICLLPNILSGRSDK